MQPNVVIVGSGIGGSTIAAALASSGCKILILERGEHLTDSPQCYDPQAIFIDGYFRPNETWLGPEGQQFNPGNYYYVGGNSKFFGAVMMRLRKQDFAELDHLGGKSPAWPISYGELEPWYQAAEQMYHVCGNAEEDPTEPAHSGGYPHPAIQDEADIARLRVKLCSAGVTPSSIPLAVDIDKWQARGKTNPWDAYPDPSASKHDAESIGLKQALQHPNVRLQTGAKVSNFTTDSDGKISSLSYVLDGKNHQLKAKLFILAAGAINSAALLLASANRNYPSGLANSSDLVGRNFMNHNCSALLAINPFKLNKAKWQKTLQFNDFYLKGGILNKPLGNVQLLGKVPPEAIIATMPSAKPVAKWLTNHSVDFCVMNEDLPNPDSRVQLVDDKIKLDWRRSNQQAADELVSKTKQVLRKAGYPILLSAPFDSHTPSHQCGTAKFGADPKSSVLNTYCKTHDHANLYVVDASFMPSSAAANPALTIVAQALRVADHIIKREFN